LSSKLILLLGGLISSIVVFSCLSQEKDSTLVKTPVIKAKKLKKPEFEYHYGKENSAKLNFIDKPLENLGGEIVYANDYKPARWSKLITEVIDFFNKYRIKDSSIKAIGDEVTINANLKKQKQVDKLNSILSKYQDSKLIIKKNIVFDSNKKFIDVKKIQNEIDKTLKEYPIYFKSASDSPTKQGLDNLNKIVQKFKDYKNIKFDLEIQGHTDSKGKSDYNKNLSQKRADEVKLYLKSHLSNLNYITSKGFGDSKPKYQNSKDRRNRRVEIIIKRGFTW